MSEQLAVLDDPAIEESARLRAHREFVFRAEEELKKFEPRPIEARHYFAHGVYAREITIPKGTYLTGHIHKYTQINIISQGEITLLTENGEVRLRAPTTVVSPPGTKRIAYAHEETVWTTILGTHETDIEKLEDELIVKTEEDYARHLEQREKLVEIA